MTTDTEALKALTPALMALAPEQVKRPSMPTAVAHQEAHELLVVFKQDAVRARALQNVKAKVALEGLEVALPASRAAQAQWTVTRERGKPEAQRERERAGGALRAEALRACDFFLDDVPEAQTPLSLIREGQGILDLISDLDTLAELIERHSDAFQDEAWDTSAFVGRLRDQASLIRAGQADATLGEDRAKAIDLRDRAYTMVHRHVDVLRRFGRYAFADTPKLEQRFYSVYEQRRGRQSRGSIAPPSDPAAAPDGV